MTSIDDEARREIASVPEMTAAGWRRYTARQLGWAARCMDFVRVQKDLHDARVYLRAAEILEEEANDHY